MNHSADDKSDLAGREDNIKKGFEAFKSKSNRWFIFFLIALASAIMTVYINNVIAVNSLLDERQSRSKELRTLQNGNKMLHSRYIELQNSEEIIKFAVDSLGLVKYGGIPVILK